MTVFSGKQVVPVDYETEVSQRLLESLMDGDTTTASDCIADPLVDVNFVGAVSLKTRKSELVLHDESASEIRVEYEEFKTDVTALFLAVNSGNAGLVRKLLSIGADVNHRLFRGFATTVAVREGHSEVFEILIKAGASQLACEESLMEASRHGRPTFAQLLMETDLIRPHVAVHALATACCRGFVDVVGTLLRCGVDADSSDRLLLQSSKPSLYTNADCVPLVAAIVNRQLSVVRMLLQAGARTDIMVRLGAWTWDMNTGEEFRVGAGLAEPYPLTWCATEYFENSGSILRLLFKHQSPNIPHRGRTLLHHAVLCGNLAAVRVILDCTANPDTPVQTSGTTEFCAIHIATRYGSSAIIKLLIASGCDVNSKTAEGDTALMISARHKHGVCVKVLAMAGADLGLVNKSGDSVVSIARSNKWSLGLERLVMGIIRSGVIPCSSKASVFSPLLYAAGAGDADALKCLVKVEETEMDEQDEEGVSAAMVAAMKGHIEALRVLVYAGADMKLVNKAGETVMSLCEENGNRDAMEKMMLEYAVEKAKGDAGGGFFYALHCAARRGDVKAAQLLICKGYGVDVEDGEGYTPLMWAAKEGQGEMCEMLMGRGAEWSKANGRGETAVTVGVGEGERAVKDEIAKRVARKGGKVMKHTKGGKGKAHMKELRIDEGRGVLCWGKSRKRQVVCKAVEVGGSSEFRHNQEQRKGSKKKEDEEGVFRVVTEHNKEVHFVCEGGAQAAQMWVRGLTLLLLPH